MRKFLRLALVIGLLFCWTDNNLLAADTADLLPLKQGTKWHYDAKVNGMSGSMIIRVANIQSGTGRPAAQLETLVNGDVTATEFLGISDEGVFRLKMKRVRRSHSPTASSAVPHKKIGYVGCRINRCWPNLQNHQFGRFTKG